MTSSCGREQIAPRSDGAVPLDAPAATNVPFVDGSDEGRHTAAPHEGNVNCLEARFAGREKTAGTAAAMATMYVVVFMSMV